MVEPSSINWQYITKQLEYINRDHIATHTILFNLKMALFFSFSDITDIIILLTQSHLSIAQASSSFKHLNTRMVPYMPNPPL